MEYGACGAVSGCRAVLVVSHEISPGQTVPGDEKAVVSFGKDGERYLAVSGICGNGRLPCRHGKYRGRGNGDLFRRTGRCLLDVVHCLYRSEFGLYGIRWTQHALVSSYNEWFGKLLAIIIVLFVFTSLM